MPKITCRRFKQIFVEVWKDLRIFLPLFFVSIILSVIIELKVNAPTIHLAFGQNLLPAVFFATLAGILLPFPKYLSYPVAAALYAKGAFIGAVFGFISGEVMIGNLAEDAMEIKYFGWRFYITRFFLSLLFIALAGIILQVIL